MTGTDPLPDSVVRAVPFLAAGLLMLVSVALIVLDRFDLHKVPQAWVAMPAIAAQAACICGLMVLRPLLRHAVLLSRLGLGCALAAAVIIAAGGLWLGLLGGTPDRGADIIYMLAFAYIVTICLAFVLFAVATFRIQGARSLLAYLLMVPAVLWTMLVIAAVLIGPHIALSLDWMTNAVISMVLLATGEVLRRAR